MIISICHNNQDYKIETQESIDISIPFNFNGKQPNFYDVKEGKLDYLKFEKKIAKFSWVLDSIEDIPCFNSQTNKRSL